MHPSRREKKVYTATEVGTLIESFRNDIAIIAEDITTIKRDVAVLKEDMRDVKQRLKVVEDVSRVALPQIFAPLDRLDAKVFSNN